MLKRERVLLAFTLFFSFAYFYPGGFSNPNSRYDLSLALAYQHTYQIDDLHNNTIDKVFYQDHYFSEKAPGVSYAAWPAALLTRLFCSPLSTLLKSDVPADLSLYLATLTAISSWSAVSSIFLLRLLNLVNPTASETRNLFLTFVIYTGTLAFPYSTTLFAHQLAASILAVSLYFCLNALAYGKTKYFALASLLLGLMVFTEYPTALIALTLWSMVAIKSKLSRAFLMGSVGALLPLLLIFLHNHLAYGDFLVFGYGKLEGTPFETGMSHGLFGVSFPNLSIMRQLTFGKYRGLLIYCPILILALIGYYYWFQKPGKFGALLPASLLMASVLILMLNSAYYYWQGGVCFGPRHLVVIIPMLAPGLARLPNSILKHPLSWLVITLSVLINLTGTSTTLFLDEQATNPLAKEYREFIKNNQVSLNPLGFATPFEPAERDPNKPDYKPSFNLGERMGLKGLVSILPLVLIWITYLLHLFRIRKTYPPEDHQQQIAQS